MIMMQFRTTLTAYTAAQFPLQCLQSFVKNIMFPSNFSIHKQNKERYIIDYNIVRKQILCKISKQDNTVMDVGLEVGVQSSKVVFKNTR